jgi:hypothetical protein
MFHLFQSFVAASVFILQVASVLSGCCICFHTYVAMYVLDVLFVSDVCCIQVFHVARVSSCSESQRGCCQAGRQSSPVVRRRGRHPGDTGPTWARITSQRGNYYIFDILEKHNYFSSNGTDAITISSSLKYVTLYVHCVFGPKCRHTNKYVFSMDKNTLPTPFPPTC